MIARTHPVTIAVAMRRKRVTGGMEVIADEKSMLGDWV